MANLCRLFADKVGLSDLGEFIGLLHDLGKYSSEFQAYLGSAVGLINPDDDDFVDAAGMKGRIDHSTAGGQFAWQEFLKKEGLGGIVGQFAALCIVSHHSGMIDCLSADSNKPSDDVFSRRLRKADDRTHLCEAIRNLDESIRARLMDIVASGCLESAFKVTVSGICQSF